MYISKKKTYKILVCAMSLIFCGGISGGVASADDSNNEVEVTDTTIIKNGTTSTRVDGSRVDAGGNDNFEGNANENKLTINSGTFNSFVNGGRAYKGNTNANFVTIEGGTFTNWVEGGWATIGNANNNTVLIKGGTFNGTIIDGGYTNIGEANYNTVLIKGGTFDFSTGTLANRGIYGGYVAESGNAIGNYTNINGGTIIGNVYGGRAPNGIASDNEINIFGNPTLAEAILIAGSGGSFSNNTLKIHTTNLTVYDIQGFENLNFYLPANTTADVPVLIVKNPTQQISNNIYVYKDKNSTFNDNDEITLITTESPNGLKLGDIQNNPDNLKITEVKEDNIVKGLVINAKDITRITPEDEEEKNKMNPSIRGGGEHIGSTIFNQGIADSVSLLDSGTDRILEWLPPEGLDYMNSSPTAGFDPFVGIGGSKLEIDTGNGTKLKTKNAGINFGMTRYLKNRHGIFIIAPVIDYGQDSYESTLDDVNRTQGNGHSKYLMGGLIARQACVNGMYYEASLRGGKIKTDFHSDNFLVNSVPTSASYEASTPCFAGHLRIGWRNHISPKNILDVYGMYSLNHIKGFKTTVSTGEDYSFSSVNSGRMRVGARLTRELRERESVYSSISFIHEFTGTTTGEYMGMSNQRTGLKGSAGLIELGWQVKPAKNSATMIDTSISCWVGDRRGFMFATKLKKDF